MRIWNFFCVTQMHTKENHVQNVILDLRQWRWTQHIVQNVPHYCWSCWMFWICHIWIYRVHIFLPASKSFPLLLCHWYMLGIFTDAFLQICYTLRQIFLCWQDYPSLILKHKTQSLLGGIKNYFNGIGRSVILLKHSTFLPICLLCIMLLLCLVLDLETNSNLRDYKFLFTKAM